jgi:hypothetical protein
MNWMNWKTWTAVALVGIAIFAIYIFAAPDQRDAPRTAVRGQSARATSTAPPGVEPVHLDLLEAEPGSFRSDRNLFMYKEPPPKPPPPPPPPPTPPADRDQDGVPDANDNCPDTPNPDQRDIDRDGIGTACETEPEVPPPPPPPTPPQFTMKFIGVFGRPENPIAAFTRESEIVNARVGDVIDGKFVLRRIGIESVEIGYVGFPPDRTQRIPLNQ